MPRYHSVFTRKAHDSIARLDDDDMLQLERWLDAIEANPRKPGDYSVLDQTGRELHVTLLERLMIVFWVDDAVSEVRILEIEASR